MLSNHDFFTTKEMYYGNSSSQKKNYEDLLLHISKVFLPIYIVENFP